MLPQDIVRALQLAAHLHLPSQPASEQELAQVEAILGYRLPSALRSLYLFGNGLYLCKGDLQTLPLGGEDDDLALPVATANLRKWGWPIPDEVLIWGDNGSDDLFGLWLPETAPGAPFDHPILQIGEVFEPACMAIMGADLYGFLRGWCAYYLMAYEAELALDALGVPASLRVSANHLDDDDMEALLRWANPHLPAGPIDPYQNGYDVACLHALFDA